MTSFLYRFLRIGEHVDVRVFAGPDEQHRAFLGRLVFRPAEWADFKARIAGPGHTVLADHDDDRSAA